MVIAKKEFRTVYGDTFTGHRLVDGKKRITIVPAVGVERASVTVILTVADINGIKEFLETL